MVAGSTSTGELQIDVSLPLTLEILQGRGKTRRFPAEVVSLSSRGAILNTPRGAGTPNLEAVEGREVLIHLPAGELREIRGVVLWARPHGEHKEGAAFGVEFNRPDLKVRRALEEYLPGYPQDLKNLWDNWDALQEIVEPPGPRPLTRPVPEGAPAPPVAPAEAPPSPVSRASDPTFYWVGLGAMVAGGAWYYLAPEAYRLFGVILAAYGCLTVAGKSVWSMWQSRV
jgi:hypothetical protein